MSGAILSRPVSKIDLKDELFQMLNRPQLKHHDLPDKASGERLKEDIKTRIRSGVLHVSATEFNEMILAAALGPEPDKTAVLNVGGALQFWVDSKREYQAHKYSEIIMCVCDGMIGALSRWPTKTIRRSEVDALYEKYSNDAQAPHKREHFKQMAAAKERGIKLLTQILQVHKKTAARQRELLHGAT